MNLEPHSRVIPHFISTVSIQTRNTSYRTAEIYTNEFKEEKNTRKMFSEICISTFRVIDNDKRIFPGIAERCYFEIKHVQTCKFVEPGSN